MTARRVVRVGSIVGQSSPLFCTMSGVNTSRIRNPVKNDCTRIRSMSASTSQNVYQGMQPAKEKNTTPKKTVYSRWKPWTWSRFQKQPKKSEDIALLQRLADICKSLEHIPYSDMHPAHDIAKSLVRQIEELDENNDIQKLLQMLFDKISTIFEEFEEHLSELPDAGFGDTTRFDTGLRVLLYKNYILNIQKAVESEEFPVTNLNSTKLIELTEVILRGSADERLVISLKIFAGDHNVMSPPLLQESLYSIYEPEVETCKYILLGLQRLHKDHIKKVPKFTKTYLLDILELNSKSRCIFCWSDPKFEGFHMHPDTDTKTINELLECRRKYFADLTRVGFKYVDAYRIERDMYWVDKEEFNENMRYGFVFFILTCIADYYIGMI